VKEKPNSSLEYLKIFFGVALSRKGAYENPQMYENLVNTIYGRTQIADHVCTLFREHLEVDSRRETTILDEASGSGVLTMKLAESGYKVIATDIEPKALKRIEEKNLQGLPVQTVNADINQPLPLENSVADGAVILSANRYINDVDIFLSEIHRVLKPNGVFIWPFDLIGALLWKAKSPTGSLITQGDIIPVLESKGFEIISSEKFNYYARKHIQDKVPFYVIPKFIISKKA